MIMTYSPARLLDERAVWKRETGLPAESLGIQHYAPDGGGYHEGNDLLSRAGRLTSDYSKRQSERDRPGTDGASAFDIGYFDVNVQKADGAWRRVTLRDYNAWMVVQMRANAPDVAFVRELIYSPDGKVVKREDRLQQSTTGDSSHLTHSHRSDFRDDENADKAAHVERFWREMRGQTGDDMLTPDDAHGWRQAVRIQSILAMATTVPDSGDPAEINKLAGFLRDMDHKLDLLLAEAAADRARDDAHAAALSALTTGGGNVDVTAVINAVNAAAGEVKTAVLSKLAQAARASAGAIEPTVAQG